MTLITAIQGYSGLLPQVADPAIRALVLAGAAGAALSLFRIRSTSPRLFTWTAVLYAALVMPLLGWMLPPLSVPMPSFLQNQAAARTPARVADSETDISATIPGATSKERAAHTGAARTKSPATQNSPSFPVSQTPPPTASAIAPATTSSFHWPSIRWSVVGVAIYLTVTLILLIRFAVGLAFAQRLVRTSEAIDDTGVVQKLAHWAYDCGLAALPRVAESEFISVPVTMGAVRPTILLPAGWRAWDVARLDAVLVHELSHVARRDGLTQRLSLLHRAIFWFSPLAWWLDQHLRDLAEQASDEAALSCGADRNDYARTLLGFFEALHAAPGRVWWQGVSMAKAGQADRRLERILAWRGAVTMGVKKSIAIAIVVCAIPVVYLAASVRSASPAENPPSAERAQILLPPQNPSTSSATPAVPAAPNDAPPPPATAPTAAPMGNTPLPTPGSAPVHGVISRGGYTPAPPAIPVAPSAPVRGPLPPAAVAGQVAPVGGVSDGVEYAYINDDDDQQRFVIVSGTTDSVTMSGNSEDVRHAKKLKKQIPGDFIWFERDEKPYIIRDQATIDRARKLWAPQEELGKKQEELGKQQEALGKQQEELSARMEKVRVKVPDMTAQLDKLRAELKELSAGATLEQVGQLQAEIGELQAKMGEIQGSAGDQQGKLGEEMGALGEKQGKLGEQQGELGRQQGELAEKASRQMKEILDEAIKNGTAKPEPESGQSPTL